MTELTSVLGLEGQRALNDGKKNIATAHQRGIGGRYIK